MASDAYVVVITAAAKKRLRRHKHAQTQILVAIHTLGSDRLSGHELAGRLLGYRSLKVFVKSSGEYRVLYSVDDANTRVIVHWIGTRENFYEEAERHLFG